MSGHSTHSFQTQGTGIHGTIFCAKSNEQSCLSIYLCRVHSSCAYEIALTSTKLSTDVTKSFANFFAHLILPKYDYVDTQLMGLLDCQLKLC